MTRKKVMNNKTVENVENSAFSTFLMTKKSFYGTVK